MLPLPGDVEGARGPQNRVAFEMPARQGAENSHLQAIQAVAPVATGSLRMATPLFRPWRDEARRRACVRVTWLSSRGGLPARGRRNMKGHTHKGRGLAAGHVGSPFTHHLP